MLYSVDNSIVPLFLYGTRLIQAVRVVEQLDTASKYDEWWVRPFVQTTFRTQYGLHAFWHGKYGWQSFYMLQFIQYRHIEFIFIRSDTYVCQFENTITYTQTHITCICGLKWRQYVFTYGKAWMDWELERIGVWMRKLSEKRNTLPKEKGARVGRRGGAWTETQETTKIDK